jgi:hypothetical protein
VAREQTDDNEKKEQLARSMFLFTPRIHTAGVDGITQSEFHESGARFSFVDAVVTSEFSESQADSGSGLSPKYLCAKVYKVSPFLRCI